MRHHSRPSTALAGSVLLVALLAGACGGSSGSESSKSDDTAADASAGDSEGGSSTTEAAADPTAVFPGDEWDTATPEEMGLDAAALDELADELEAANSSCMAVIKGGKLVDERYWHDTDASTDQEIFSATKSVSATLVGIAQDQGALSIEDKASDYITEWQGTPSEAVTVRNLISNDSGRYWDFTTDYQTMALMENDKTAFAISLDQAQDPGTHWEYNNSAIQTLERVLKVSTGESVPDFAQENLYEPIGMDVTHTTDGAGNGLTFMGLNAGCQDMARFGYLYLRDGNWDGTQIVSSEFVEEATSPSQDLNENYGFLWWLNTGGNFTEGAPEDAYAALGLGNQVVLVLPEQDMVVVRLGNQPGGDGGVATQDRLVATMAEHAVAAAGD